MNVHVGERVGPFVVVASESTIPARKRRVVVRCVVCERVSEMNERSLLDKRTEGQRACAKCRVYVTNGTWTKGWRSKMENAAFEANRLNKENADLRDEIDKVLRERDEARTLVDELRGQYQYSVGLSMALEERDQARRERDQEREACAMYAERSGRFAEQADRLQRERDLYLRERDQARQEADRLRHGLAVEGDFVCPNEYAVSELTAERNFLRALKKNHEEDFARVCKERDEARAEVEKLSESAKAAWEAECVMREQRDRYHAEWKQERQEVERLRTALLEVQTSESAPAWFADGFHDGWKAGAEAMREACAAALMADGLVLSRERAANVVRALPIPEEP